MPHSSNEWLMVRYTRLMDGSDDPPLVASDDIDTERQRFPHSVVWTPLPLLR